jgi:hypothetical protein
MKQLAPKMASNLLMQFCSGLISEGCQRTLGSILLRGQDEGYSAAEGTASCYILRRENGYCTSTSQSCPGDFRTDVMHPRFIFLA